MNELRKATLADYDAIIAFYDDVTSRTPDILHHARWQKGKHPTAEGVRSYIEEGSMYVHEEQGSIVGVMALTMYQDDMYHAVNWSQPLQDDAVAVLHIFAVSPDCQGKGLGARLVRAAVELARENGKKAVRLDTLASNVPAQHLYESLGFRYRGQQYLYAENTAWTDFYFYEFEI
jgi:ribosomal protein S18 acetylase RimI-like enzyme